MAEEGRGGILEFLWREGARVGIVLAANVTALRALTVAARDAPIGALVSCSLAETRLGNLCAASHVDILLLLGISLGLRPVKAAHGTRHCTSMSRVHTYMRVTPVHAHVRV